MTSIFLSYHFGSSLLDLHLTRPGAAISNFLTVPRLLSVDFDFLICHENFWPQYNRHICYYCQLITIVELNLN